MSPTVIDKEYKVDTSGHSQNFQVSISTKKFVHLLDAVNIHHIGQYTVNKNVYVQKNKIFK